jgi:peptidyl-prolyl cis-trans isomerase A (cyclophilin A)
MQLRYLPAAHWLRFLVTVLAALCCSAAHATIVRFQTSSGSIDVRLYESVTPLSVANFLNYANTNRYDGTFIHRVPQFKDQFNNNLGTQHFVVQGGGFRLNNSIWSASGIVTDAPIGDEFGISNTRGTLAFAKSPQGATSQWFFSVGDNSSLDASDFTVFGRVLGSGMNVVDTIDNLPAINATAAQNASGEDFDEIPIRNPLTQNDITSNEAVMVNDVQILNLPPGDYNLNGVVNNADLAIWQADYGSTIKAEADGNGDGRVDGRDFLLWQRNYGQTSALTAVTAVPEPNGLVLLSALAGFAMRRCRS